MQRWLENSNTFFSLTSSRAVHCRKTLLIIPKIRTERKKLIKKKTHMYKNNMNRQTKTLEKQKKDRLLKQSMSPCIFLSIGVFLLSSVDFHLKNQLYCIKVHYTYSYLKYCERCMWLHIQVLIPSMFKGWSWE